MNRMISKFASNIRVLFTQDAATERYLEKTYVQVALSSGFGGR